MGWYGRVGGEECESVEETGVSCLKWSSAPLPYSSSGAVSCFFFICEQISKGSIESSSSFAADILRMSSKNRDVVIVVVHHTKLTATNVNDS